MSLMLQLRTERPLPGIYWFSNEMITPIKRNNGPHSIIFPLSPPQIFRFLIILTKNALTKNPLCQETGILPGDCPAGSVFWINAYHAAGLPDPFFRNRKVLNNPAEARKQIRVPALQLLWRKDSQKPK